ncbi:MAG: galactokinase [Rufibacter sp.]
MHLLNAQSSFFKESSQIFQGSSPGRLDIMGGIADYSGSLLLQMPIQQRTIVTVACREDQMIQVKSTTAEAAGYPAEVSIPVSELLSPADFSGVRNRILQIAGGDWAIYVLGCFYLLAIEKQVALTGADVLVESAVPFGKGVSSSAAIEVATLMALEKAFEVELGKLELPLMAQRVENLLVGAPCGLMDQLSSYLGEENKLLPIVCQPVEVFPAIPIPGQVQFVGIDSGVKHAVSGNSYTNVRVAAFMGYSIIAQQIGVTAEQIANARALQNWADLPFGGYLANIPLAEFQEKFEHLLPEVISGKEFMHIYGTTIDAVTQVKPEEIYPIKACTAHPVLENARVRAFKECLEQLSKWQNDANIQPLLERAGALMYASHQSYSACGLGNDFTDELVKLVKAAGPEAGVYGAKITGGGSGGTVCVMAYGPQGLATAREIYLAYKSKLGHEIVFFEGSSAGGYYSS